MGLNSQNSCNGYNAALCLFQTYSSEGCFVKIFACRFTKAYVVGTQMNRISDALL